MPVEIWTEKYRPKRIDDIVGNEPAKMIVKPYIAYPEMFPQLMLFVGEAGTGKTSMANAIAHELYKPDENKATIYNFSEFNASDDRGINFIRTEIKKIASSSVIGNSPFRIIFLDEADYLTQEAQASLRRIIEKYNKTTRFIFSVNYPHKIISPLYSRATVIHFEPPSKEEARAFIDKIAEQEGFEIEPEAKDEIIFQTRAIPRDILIKLQACYVIAKFHNLPKITLDIVQATTMPEVKKTALAPILKSIKKSDIAGAVSHTETLINRGVPPITILNSLIDLIIQSKNIKNKNEVLQVMSEVDTALNNGATPSIQYAYLYATIIKNYKPE